MESKRFWIGVDEYLDCTLSSDMVPKWYLKIGDMEGYLKNFKDIIETSDEIQILNIQEHDQVLKSRFIKAVQRIQRLSADTRRQLFGVAYLWDVMEKHTIDFIEGVLDDYEKFKVGDEVQAESGIDIHKLYVIVNESDECYTALEKGTGQVKALYKHLNSPFGYQKTGKHFDVIEQYCKGEE